MQAIVLAGGLGTRLRSVVPDLPKPMARVAGRPFLAWLLDALQGAGFSRVVLAVGYRHEVIRQHFGDHHQGLALGYSVEPTPMGTGGALRLARQQIDADRVFVLNGDTYLALDYRAMWASHADAGAAISMAVCQVAEVQRYGALQLAAGRVEAFLEKGASGPGLINAGTYLLASIVLDALPPDGPSSFEQDLLVPQLRGLRPLAWMTEGLFIDIGVPDDYARAQGLFPLRKANA